MEDASSLAQSFGRNGANGGINLLALKKMTGKDTKRVFWQKRFAQNLILP